MLQSKPRILLVVLLAGLLSFAGSYVLATRSNKATSEQNETLSVDIYKDAAVPETVTLNTGQSVQFNSADGETYSLSLGEGGDDHQHTGPFNSGDFGEGEAWLATFDTAGTYFFHDHYNPEINILVVVYNQDSMKVLE